MHSKTAILASILLAASISVHAQTVPLAKQRLVTINGQQYQLFLDLRQMSAMLPPLDRQILESLSCLLLLTYANNGVCCIRRWELNCKCACCCFITTKVQNRYCRTCCCIVN